MPEGQHPHSCGCPGSTPWNGCISMLTFWLNVHFWYRCQMDPHGHRLLPLPLVMALGSKPVPARIPRCRSFQLLPGWAGQCQMEFPASRFWPTRCIYRWPQMFCVTKTVSARLVFGHWYIHHRPNLEKNKYMSNKNIYCKLNGVSYSVTISMLEHVTNLHTSIWQFMRQNKFFI